MKTRGAHSTGRGRLAAAFLFSLVVACAAFSFTYNIFKVNPLQSRAARVTLCCVRGAAYTRDCVTNALQTRGARGIIALEQVSQTRPHS